MTAINFNKSLLLKGRTQETENYNLGNIESVKSLILKGRVAEINIGSVHILKKKTFSGTTVVTFSAAFFGKEIFDAYYTLYWFNQEPIYTVSGKVTAKGVAVENCRVELRNRDANPNFYRHTTTDINGNFSFADVHGGKAGYYYIIAVDPSVAPDYNAVISDRINEQNPIANVDFSATNQSVKTYYHQAWDGTKWVGWQSEWMPNLTPAETNPAASGALQNIFVM